MYHPQQIVCRSQICSWVETYLRKSELSKWTFPSQWSALFEKVYRFQILKEMVVGVKRPPQSSVLGKRCHSSSKCKSLQTRPSSHSPLASMDLHSPLFVPTDLCVPSTLLSFRYRKLLVLIISPLARHPTHSPFILSCLDHLAVMRMLKSNEIYDVL